MQQHLRFPRVTTVAINDGKMSVIPGLRGTDERLTAEARVGFLNLRKCRVCWLSEWKAWLQYTKSKRIAYNSCPSHETTKFTLDGGGGGFTILNSHTAIRLLWRKNFLHFTSILPLLIISFKTHHHSITHSPKAGMFKISFNTMRQRKAKKSCN